MSPDPPQGSSETDSPNFNSAKLRRAAAVAASVAAVIPLLALIGWVTQTAMLREVLPGAIAMNPLTALSLLSGAFALGFMSRPGPGTSTVARCFALVVAGAGLARLMDPLVGGRLGLDLLFFRSQILQMVPPARMAYGSALSFICLGASLLLYRADVVKPRPTRWLLILPALVALLATAGYLYNTRVLFDIPTLKPMPLNTALAILVLCIGIAALPPPVPPLSTLMLPGSAGASARRLLPAAFLLPFVVGWLRIEGERAGWFDLGFGIAIMTVFTATVMALLVLLSVWLVQRAEAAQRELERGLRASEQRLFQILEAIPLGLYVLDHTGRPYYSNRRSSEILGTSLAASATTVGEVARSYNVRRTGTGAEYPTEQLPISHALRGESVYKADLELHQPDRVVPIEVWSAPVLAADGSIEFAISTFNDITERQETERQIVELNAELGHQVIELAAVNRELETFSYSVSHDLRAPLRAVDGFSQMLTEDHAAVLGPEGLRLLDRIRSNIRRMGLLIDDLLRFSRLSRQELEAAPVDMAGLVRTILEDMSRTRGQQVPVVVGNLPPAHGDIDLLRQVWVNLIDNGLKYSGKSGAPRVEVGAESNGHEIQYWVRDNGVGFDMAYADKLFGVFQRLHAQDEFEGTGVGLAIVQRVVHRHGGRVWAEGRPRQGATFSFSLPVGGENVAR